MRIGNPNKGAVNLLVNAAKQLQGNGNLSNITEIKELENIIKVKGKDSKEAQHAIENFTQKHLLEKYPGAYVQAEIELNKRNNLNKDAVTLLVNAARNIGR